MVALLSGADPAQPRARLHAFDHLKAWAIVAVVITHAGPEAFGVVGERWVHFASKAWTAFHVPSFLFVSGYLYAVPHPVPLRRVGQRLLRVLIPYALACAVGLGLVLPPASLREAVERIAFGNVVGIYYYVFLFVTCLLLMAPLSRLGRRGALALWAAYAAYSLAVVFAPQLRTSEGIFWLLRDPLQLFNFGFFLTGWVVGSWQPELSALARRHGWLLPAVALGLAVPGLALEARFIDVEFGGLNRVPYSLGVVALFAWLFRDRPAGPTTRFLADATLAIYLHHIWAIVLLRPRLAGWAPAAELLALVAAGLFTGVGLAWLARRALGSERARRWVGA